MDFVRNLLGRAGGVGDRPGGARSAAAGMVAHPGRTLERRVGAECRRAGLELLRLWPVPKHKQIKKHCDTNKSFAFCPGWAGGVGNHPAGARSAAAGLIRHPGWTLERRAGAVGRRACVGRPALCGDLPMT